MATSEDGLAHPYVDTAHRAALLYAFATLLVAAFVELSGWSDAVNLVAAFAAISYFAAAIATYVWHGWHRDTDNQIRTRHAPRTPSSGASPSPRSEASACCSPGSSTSRSFEGHPDRATG
jgi:hypothetical protein